MEHVNEDMDDLFRKAGDHYPLKTTGSDWDGVLGKLRKEIPGEQESMSRKDAQGKNKIRRWGLLLLLIPLGLGSLIYFSSGTKSKITLPAEELQKANVKPNAEKVSANMPVEKFIQPGIEVAGTGNKLLDESKINKTLSRQQSVLHKSIQDSKKYSTSFSTDPQSLPKSDSERSSAAVTVPGKPGTPSTPDAGISPDQKSGAADAAAVAAASGTVHAVDEAGPNKSIEKTDSLPVAKIISTDSTTSTSTIKKKDTASKKPKGFYVGILIGPDWTTVKFQSVKQTGFSLGVLAGYQFNRKISLESGLYWDKKYYYSTVEYFSTKNLPVRAGDTVINLNGYCNMLEIPFNIRYNFGTNNRRGYYAKLGFSSYLMKKEVYSYLIDSINLRQTRMIPYYNTTQTFFAVLQISGGYETAISNKAKIWIEPYIKIPLQHVGIASIPISSAGMYFGMTYSFK